MGSPSPPVLSRSGQTPSDRPSCHRVEQVKPSESAKGALSLDTIPIKVIVAVCFLLVLTWYRVEFRTVLWPFAGFRSICAGVFFLGAGVTFLTPKVSTKGSSTCAGPVVSGNGHANDNSSHEGPPCLQGIIDPGFPKNVVHRSNATEALPFDCGNCYGEILIIHKPTPDKAAMAAGDYPHAEHIHGRKRLWEMRWNLHFRERVEPGTLRLGMEQDKYYWPGYIQYRVSLVFVKAMKAVAGGCYQSMGDDPATTVGEVERPIISFPIWLADQILVTPEGQKPPDLHDPNFGALGQTKSSDRKAFKQAIDGLAFEPGPTYTIAIWCIAQYVDAVRWALPGIRGLPETPMLQVGIHPPSFFIMYSLKPDAEAREGSRKQDQRHLDSRKTVYFRMAIWSSLLPAPVSRQRELMQMPEKAQHEETTRDRDCCVCCCQ